MLEKHEKEQERAVSILRNQIWNNTLGHAYIFVMPQGENKLQFIKDFIKEIINADQEVSKKIDREVLIDLKFIRPDGIQIKKQQIAELQEEFSTKAIEIGKKIYILEEAEKLNVSAANTLLKFLEEPSDNIIALLTTENLEAVLATIKSRCSIIHLIPNNKEENGDENIREAARRFIEKYETNGLCVNIYVDEMVFVVVKEKQEMEKFLKAMIYIYNEMLKHKIRKELFVEEKQNIIIEKNTLKRLIEKIRILVYLKKQIRYNMNLKLLMDKMVFLFQEVENE